MDWVKELREYVGVTDEGYAADLNDVEGRDILTEDHLKRIKEVIAENMDADGDDSAV